MNTEYGQRTHYSVNGWSARFPLKETMVNEGEWMIAADQLAVREGLLFRLRTIRWDSIVPALQAAFPDRYFVAGCHGGIVRMVRLDDAAEKMLMDEGNDTAEMRKRHQPPLRP